LLLLLARGGGGGCCGGNWGSGASAFSTDIRFVFSKRQVDHLLMTLRDDERTARQATINQPTNEEGVVT